MSLAKRAVTCGLTCALALGVFASPALADPQSELAAAQERMEALGSELSVLQGDLADLSSELERTDNEMERTQESIDETQLQLADARATLSMHVRSGYKSGGFDAVEFILSSSSLEDFVSRFHYMEKVNASEVAQINAVHELERSLETELAQLEDQRAVQAERVSDAEAKVAEYEQLVSEAQAYYWDLDAQVQAELAAAAAQEAAEQEAAAQALAAAVAVAEDTTTSESTDEGSQTEETQEETYETQEDTQQQETVPEESSSSYDTGGSCYPGGGVASAYSCIGWDYVWGGFGPSMGGFDCSGLVSYCYGDGSWRRGCESFAWAIQNAGLWKYGMENLSYGDLLFTDSEYNHVGIYIGDGMMIHSPTFGRTVCVDTVWSCYGGGPFVMP